MVLTKELVMKPAQKQEIPLKVVVDNGVGPPPHKGQHGAEGPVHISVEERAPGPQGTGPRDPLVWRGPGLLLVWRGRGLFGFKLFGGVAPGGGAAPHP